LSSTERKNLQYYEISAKSNYNYEKPFLWLARKLLKQDDLVLVEAPALKPPEIPLDEQQIKAYELELEQAKGTPLPEDEDEDF